MVINKYKLKQIRRKAVLLLLFPVLLFFIFVFRILPIRWIRRFGDFGGKLFYRFAEKSRERALNNIQMIYGETLSENERINIVKTVCVEMIKSFFDYMAYSHVKSKEKFFKLIEVEGEEHLKTAYEKGKGVICLIPHISSWEFAAITPPMLGYETSAASKAMKSNLLESLMVKFRGSRGMKNITREGSYQALVDVLQKGECLVIMTDQDTKVKGLFVDFMGKTAYTPLGASRLLADTEAVLVPMVMTRKEDENYRFIIYPELPSVKTENPENDLLKNTENQNNIIGEMVQKYTNQWVWMHERWKTTPESLARYLKARAEEKKRK